MATYNSPPPHVRLDVFFADMFKEMRKAPPEAYGAFLMRAEEEFKRTGYREIVSGGHIENILIVRLDVIGDQILTSGFIREARKNFPTARITLVVAPFIKPMVELCPYVNEVLTFDRNSLGNNFPEALEHVAVFCRDNLWRKKFSIAFSPQWSGYNLPSLILMWLSGARERIGYGTNSHNVYMGNSDKNLEAQDNFFLTKNVVIPHDIILEVQRHLYLLPASGFKVTETHMELWYGSEDSRRAKEWLEKLPSSKKVLLGIGAGDANRKYPVDKYLVALRELVNRHMSFIIVGEKNEFDDANFIEQNMPRGTVLNLVGKTTLRETEAIVAQADFYIGNDTGVLHMAAAAKVPVLCVCREATDRENILPGIFSILQRFYPYQTKSIILRPAHPLGECATLPPIYGWCHNLREPHCITQIPPQAIIEGFEKLQAM